jgi:outer membrane murein-binding lipoprotein Lpp
MMHLYEGWHTGKGEGANITIIQLLAHANSEYKCLVQLGQWTTKQKSSELLGLQAKIDHLQTQFMALAAENTKLKNKVQSLTRPTGAPKEEENEKRTVNGVKWYYCSKCWSGRRWNTTHKTEQQ